jgi:hypothetical protein
MAAVFQANGLVQTEREYQRSYCPTPPREKIASQRAAQGREKREVEKNTASTREGAV